jgi:hypothetical protein
MFTRGYQLTLRSVELIRLRSQLQRRWKPALETSMLHLAGTTKKRPNGMDSFNESTRIAHICPWVTNANKLYVLWSKHDVCGVVIHHRIRILMDI